MVRELADKVLSHEALSRDEALGLTAVEGAEVFALFASANLIRQALRPPVLDLCSIVSAKTGHCPEDCRYCAQSKVSEAEIQKTPLVSQDEVVARAKKARQDGARRFCIVTGGKKPTKDELARIAEMISAVRDEGLLPCATLGLLDAEELALLKDAGLHRYHHNLEASRRFFPEVCSTHTYDDKLRTITAAKDAGLSVCSGGIFGLGEQWEDRVDMALELRWLDVDSVPINFLVPVKGTPLGEAEPLAPLEALRIISLYRFVLGNKEIRVCGGRLQTLGKLNALVIMAGADGLLTGDCLTVAGRSAADDVALARAYGLEIASS